MTTKTVPAHPPSKADPAAAGIAALFTIAALVGLPLDQWLTAAELAALLGAIATVAATVRTVWQRVNAEPG
jgi:hypothetical protein